jgi:hypothetical protein
MNLKAVEPESNDSCMPVTQTHWRYGYLTAPYMTWTNRKDIEAHLAINTMTLHVRVARVVDLNAKQ